MSPVFNPSRSAQAEMRFHWLAGPAACAHGSHCSCQMLARAAGVDTSSIDYNFCHHVLQKRWGMNCDHLPDRPRSTLAIQPPPHDARDPVHALLIANMEFH